MIEIHSFSKNHNIRELLKKLENKDCTSFFWSPSEMVMLEKVTLVNKLVVLDYTDQLIHFLDSISSRFESQVLIIAKESEIEEKSFSELISRPYVCGGDTDLKISESIRLKNILTMASYVKEIYDKSALNERYSKVLAQMLQEVQRVKRIHTKLVPMRSEVHNRVRISSKYSSGLSSGGEFFDYIKFDDSIFLISSSTDSYVVSSIILSEIERVRHFKSSEKIELTEIIYHLIDELDAFDGLSKESISSLNFTIFEIDLKKLNIVGYSFGELRIFSNSKFFKDVNSYPFSKEFVEKSFFEVKLDRDMKLAFLSPGVFKNFSDKVGQLSFDEYISQSIKDSDYVEFLNDLFFHLKKNLSERFLNFDATCFYIEVDKNVILEV